MHEKENSSHVPTHRFSLGFSDDSGPFIIDVELASVGGRIGCVALEVRSYARSRDELETHHRMGLPTLEDVEAVITAGLLRRVKVGEAVAEAVEDLRSAARAHLGDLDAIPDTFEAWVVGLDDSAESRAWNLRQFEIVREFHRSVVERASNVLDQAPHEGRGPGRPPISDETLTRVADLYNEAYRDGNSRPVLYVAQSMGKPHKLVKGWVSKARKKGFLPPTQPGTARGTTTEDTP